MFASSDAYSLSWSVSSSNGRRSTLADVLTRVCELKAALLSRYFNGLGMDDFHLTTMNNVKTAASLEVSVISSEV